ncbi:MAG: Lrp/AsnC family transcriptional regulator, partial [Burkholderiales bacterium]|nr:Lrp/AsnC family transcriptional regulator [Burkholderiales bacterium]
DADRALAALVEDGLPLIERPFDAWAQALGWQTDRVLQVLARWLDQGTLRRFGLIVRHHEFGFTHNAMAVFDVPDTRVDALGPRLAEQPGITLCYRRERAEGWPFNLYGMVHGRDRDSVRSVLASACQAAGLDELPQQVLFSWRRYKQTGARRFRDLPVMETEHAHAG